MKQLFALCMVFFLSGCYAPWQVEQYVVEKGVGFDYPSTKESIVDKYKEYNVNNVTARIFIKAHDETTKSGTGPFKVFINVFSNEQITVNATLLNLRIVSESGKEFVLSDEILPFNFHFEDYSQYDAFIWDTYRVETPLDFDFEKGERIFVSIKLEVKTNEASSTKELEYIFKPKLKKGYFQWIEV